MKYAEFALGFVGKPGSLYVDHGVYSIMFGTVEENSNKTIYRITEVHEDFMIIASEKAELEGAGNRSYAVPFSHVHLILV